MVSKVAKLLSRYGKRLWCPLNWNFTIQGFEVKIVINGGNCDDNVKNKFFLLPFDFYSLKKMFFKVPTFTW